MGGRGGTSVVWLARDQRLGRRVALELTPLRAPYCDLLRDIWARVPVVTQGARPQRIPPPRSHRCAH